MMFMRRKSILKGCGVAACLLALVGCKKDSDEPCGELADEALRAARIAAHRAFDPIWEQGLMTKREAYDWLAQALTMSREDCKIGLMKLEDCSRVGQVVWVRFGELAQG